MRTKWTTYSRCSRAAGLTLIEVVAAIAILGTLLVGIVLAKSRHTRQIALAQRTLVAVEAADELIGQWWVDPAGVPINASGRIDGDSGLEWRTQLVHNEPIEALGVRVVRVAIMDTTPSIPQARPNDRELVRVDLVVADPSVVEGESTAVANDTPMRREAVR